MPNTTNYNWDIPADTDLVKDGAAAMRTLGNSIDTTTKNLNPETTLGDIAYRSATANTNTRLPIGTTGQVLTVAGGVPTWAAPAGDITGVTAGTGLSGGGTSGDVTLTNTVATAFDAKGDLIVGTGADTFSKLTVGTNGHTLVADSSTATGLKWAAAASGGAYTSLATGSLSGASVSLTSISGSYTDLYLVLRDVNLNSDSYIGYRFNNDTTANFHISLNTFSRIGGGAQTIANSTTYVEGTYWWMDSGDNDSAFNLRVNDYASSMKKTGITQSTFKSDNGNEGVVFVAWGYSGTSAITRIDILTGSTFNGGTYELFGVK